MKRIGADPTKDLFIGMLVIFITADIVLTQSVTESGSVQITKKQTEQAKQATENKDGAMAKNQVILSYKDDTIYINKKPIDQQDMLEQIASLDPNLVVIDVPDAISNIGHKLQQAGYAISLQ